MIEVKHLVKRYGRHTAVNDISFTMEPGKIYGFLGPNGAGKSSTINMITGYLGATAGEVLMNGKNILAEPEEAKRCIGYLPEIAPLYTDMYVEEYLNFCAQLKKIRRDQRAEAVNEAIKMCSLQEVRRRLIRNLSKGYRQRVGLAQALLGMPETIILDEPMVGLDPKQIIEIRELICGLRDRHTVLMSSHIMQEVTAVCDQVLILSHGRLVAADTPENLEKMMSGSNRLEMEIRSGQDTLAHLFRGLSGIRTWKSEPAEDGNYLSVVLELDGSQDIREELFYRCAKADAPIRLMKYASVSLEEVFLELTADGGESEQTERRKK